MNSTHKSPFDAFLSETLSGLSTIKAYSQQENYIQHELLLIDHLQIAVYLYMSLTVWFNFRLSLLSSLVTLFLCLLASQSSNYGSGFAAAIGLSLTYASTLAETTSRFLFQLGAGEAEMNSIERLAHYGFNLVPEVNESDFPSESSVDFWPSKGLVQLNNVEISYPSRPDHSVIKNLSLTITPGQNIGIVGRTGSGKSTLISALFRIMELKSGSIEIDGIDIKTLDLKTLRSRIQLIPQDPILFEGTVRTNLDHTNTKSEEDIWDALSCCGLAEYVAGLPDKLDSQIDESGSNFSAGQKQMICLARSILKSPKLMVMDEATSSIDSTSDELISKIILNDFKDITVISIAHRISSIIAFDKILVLDQGNLVEFDTPLQLLKNKGLFYEMCLDQDFEGLYKAALAHSDVSGKN
jgi:ABC-type multidrug transport system fused ATPase/permease subunit